MSDSRQWMQASATNVQAQRTRTNPAPSSTAHPAWDASDVTLFDRDWLSHDVADLLAACQQDWVGLLQPDWKLELYDLNALGSANDPRGLKHSRLSVTDLVFRLRQARSQPLTLFYQEHWGYTCCLQVAGLGRVRLVACFNNPQCFGNHAVFVTNRLDWSPHRIVTQWTQRRSAAVLSGRNLAKLHSEDSLQWA